jgi:gluconolactonase
VLRLVLLAALLAGAAAAQPADFGDYVPPGAALETLATGFTWSEGPVWRPAEGDLLFSDVPENTVYRWSDADGLSVFLRPSGLAFDDGHEGDTGSNGLALVADGLLLADHGNRVVARLNPRTFVRETLASRYDGRRLNSPNDLAVHASGAVYFTDPPYGLAGQDDSPEKELAFNGVYRLSPDGAVTLLVDDLTRPNGIAFSPDERTLYVANSDPARAVWMAYPVRDDGTVGEGRLLFDATAFVGPDRPGLPDGMAVGADGTLFATGPGGVLVLTPDGRHLGTIQTDRAVANVAFGDDGRTLYLTAHDTLQRIRLTARGAGF